MMNIFAGEWKSKKKKNLNKCECFTQLFAASVINNRICSYSYWSIVGMRTTSSTFPLANEKMNPSMR